jgi:glycerol kinase
MPAILALDQGTTGSTALVIGDDGHVVSRAYREFTQHFPAPGMVEHDTEEIWRVTLETARDAAEQAGVEPAGIGITNQRETVVAWDRRTGAPLHRALVWQDRRTAARCRALRAELGDEWVARRTGLVWDPYFSATKIEWLLAEVPELRDRAESGDAVFGTIDAWLVYRLTGGRAFVTDHTNASRTLLYNLAQQDWDEELLELFGVPRVSLPDIRRSSEIVGTAEAEHLGVEIPIAGIAGDQQAALFGQGCWEPGQAKCTYGTGAFLLMSVGADLPADPRRGGVLTTVSCDATGGPSYALEGSIFMAREVPDTAGVSFVPAFVGLGAPHWEAEARGTIVGLTRGTTRAHLVRAALEAMAYSTCDVAENMAATSGVSLAVLKADGGAAANDWLIQFQADALGVRVARPDVVETTALGAAGLAGLATGVWDSPEAFMEGRSYRWFEPGHAPADGHAAWRRAVDATLYWARAANPDKTRG